MVVGKKEVDEGRLWREFTQVHKGIADVKGGLSVVEGKVEAIQVKCKETHDDVNERLKKVESRPVQTKEINIANGLLKVRGFNPKEVGRIIIWMIVVYLFLSEIGVAPKDFVKTLLENKDVVAETVHALEHGGDTSPNSL